jgi:hypothetical protein
VDFDHSAFRVVFSGDKRRAAITDYSCVAPTFIILEYQVPLRFATLDVDAVCARYASEGAETHINIDQILKSGYSQSRQHTER